MEAAGEFNGYLDQECVEIGGQVGMRFKLAVDNLRVRVRKFVYDTDKAANLNGKLVELCVDGNWEIRVRDYGSEMMSIYADRVNSGFLPMKILHTHYTEVGRLG